MGITYLTPQQALRALADGKVLENDDGMDVLLLDGKIMLRYTMGKHNNIVTDTYNDSFDKKLFIPMEEENASE